MKMRNKKMIRKLRSGYKVDIDEKNFCSAGKIYHSGIRADVLVGSFIAQTHEEDATFVKHRQLDLFLNNYLRFSQEEDITIDVSNIEGFAGPDKTLLSRLKKYRAVDLPTYNPGLIKDIVMLLNELENDNLPVGVNIYSTEKPAFREYGTIWKDEGDH